MSNDNDDTSDFNYLFIGALAFLLVSLGCFIVGEYERIIFMSIMAVVLAFLGWVYSKFSDAITAVMILIVLPIGLIGGAFYGINYADMKNEEAPQQIFCGNVGVVKDYSHYKGNDYFEIIGSSQNLFFPLYPRDKKYLSTASEPVCVRYSWNEKWSRAPHVFEIYPESSR